MAADRDGLRDRTARALKRAVRGASRRTVLGLFTELMAPGETQRISLHAAAALTAFARKEERPVRFLSLNDPLGQHDLDVAGERIAVRGFGGSKVRFALATLAAVPHIGFAYIGHSNLAPLGIVAKLLRPRAWYCVATYGIEVWEPPSACRRFGLKRARVVTNLSEFTAQRLATAKGPAGRPVVMIPQALEHATRS